MVFRYLLVLLMLAGIPAFGQRHMIDSLQQKLKTTGQDTTRVRLYSDLSGAYKFFDADTMVLFAERMIQLSNRLHYKHGVAEGHNALGLAYGLLRRHHKDALEEYREARRIFYQLGDTHWINGTTSNVGLALMESGHLREAGDTLEYARKMLAANADSEFLSITLCNLGSVYGHRGQIDTALVCYQQAVVFGQAKGASGALLHAHYNMALLLLKNKNYYEAGPHLKEALRLAQEGRWEVFEKVIVQKIRKCGCVV